MTHPDGTYYVAVTSVCSTRHCIALWLDIEGEDARFMKAGGTRERRGDAIGAAEKWARELGVEYRPSTLQH